MTAQTSPTRVHADQQPSDWWRHAAVYEVYPRSFADGNGDGEGDVAGVRARLQYIADLGCEAIWFNPFYKSPLKDGGYDVSDYRDIDPVFGSVAEVEAMIKEAHELGIKIILDIVPNHCSTEHRWFQEAWNTEPGSDAWKRFHLLKGKGENGELPPNNWRSVFGGAAWTQHELNGKPTGYWYLHIFDSSQPDFNWEHPDVHEEFKDTLRFWFDRGVDGFRIDVTHGLIKAKGYPDYPEVALQKAEGTLLDPEPLPHWDQPEVHAIYREWRKVCDEYDNRMFVGEVWVSTNERLARYLRQDELHSAFNFSHLDAPWDAQKQRSIIDESLEQNAAVGSPTTWVLENHDVTRAVTRYSGVETTRDEDSGVPTRLPKRNLTADEIALGTKRARAAMLEIFALPGTCYLYNGEELGLFEVVDLPDAVRQDPTFFRTNGKVKGRDGCRVPMSWSGDKASYGFNDGDKSWLPQPKEWAELSVAAQTGKPDSTLELTRKALHIRKAYDAFGDGTMLWRDDLAQQMTENPADLLVWERPGKAGPSVFVAMNFGSTSITLPANATVLVASSEIQNGNVLADNSTAYFTL